MRRAHRRAPCPPATRGAAGYAPHSPPRRLRRHCPERWRRARSRSRCSRPGASGSRFGPARPRSGRAGRWCRWRWPRRRSKPGDPRNARARGKPEGEDEPDDAQHRPLQDAERLAEALGEVSHPPADEGAERNRPEEDREKHDHENGSREAEEDWGRLFRADRTNPRRRPGASRPRRRIRRADWPRPSCSESAGGRSQRRARSRGSRPDRPDGRRRGTSCAPRR